MDIREMFFPRGINIYAIVSKWPTPATFRNVVMTGHIARFFKILLKKWYFFLDVETKVLELSKIVLWLLTSENTMQAFFIHYSLPVLLDRRWIAQVFSETLSTPFSTRPSLYACLTHYVLHQVFVVILISCCPLTHILPIANKVPQCMTLSCLVYRSTSKGRKELFTKVQCIFDSFI